MLTIGLYARDCVRSIGVYNTQENIIERVRILTQHYTSQKKIHSLIILGNIIEIDSLVSCTKRHPGIYEKFDSIERFWYSHPKALLYIDRKWCWKIDFKLVPAEFVIQSLHYKNSFHLAS